MIRLLDHTNVDAADSDFPYGIYRDNPGDFTGTPMDKRMVFDWAQFFDRLMDKAGITPNGVFDSDYSGFQLFDAYLGAMFQDKQVPSYLGTWQANASDPIKFRLVGSKTVTMRGKTSNSSPAGYTSDQNIFTLPVGYRPLKTRKLIVFTVASDSYTVVQIATSGVVTILGATQAFDSEETELNLSFEID